VIDDPASLILLLDDVQLAGFIIAIHLINFGCCDDPI
jgi:hypothetical protein